MDPVVRQGLVAPGIVVAVGLVTLGIAGSVAALLVITAGAGTIVAFHLWHLRRVTQWANGPQDADVPEGRGEWAELLAAIYRRMRVRRAYERDLRQVIERFRQAASAVPDGIVVLDAANRIDWANERAIAQLGLDLRHDR